MATIKVRRNGPYRLENKGLTIVDWNGQKYTLEGENVALCRCGASETKPFCDGAHSRIGFVADSPAEEGSS